MPDLPWAKACNKGRTYVIALVQAICMTQIAETTKGERISMKRGLKLWYEQGWNTVEGELSQILNREFF